MKLTCKGTKMKLVTLAARRQLVATNLLQDEGGWVELVAKGLFASDGGCFLMKMMYAMVEKGMEGVAGGRSSGRASMQA